MTAVAVTNSSLFFSPWNWYSDGAGAMQANNAKGSSTFAQSNTPGAYLKFNVTIVSGGSVTLELDNAHLSTVASGDFPQIAVFTDGGAPTVTQLSGTTTQSLTLGSSLSVGSHSFVALFKAAGLATSDRWTTPRLSVKVTGLTIPADASMAAATLRTDRILIYGDSITEGVHALGTTTAPADQDAGYGWAHMLAATLDAEVGVVGFGGQSYAATGLGNVPVFVSTYDLYSAGRSRLVSTQLSPVPDRVLVAHGENDTTGGSLPATITTALAALRAATTAPLFVLVPFTGKVRSDIGSATLPSNTRIIDVQLSGGDGSHLIYYPGNQTPLHPTIAGSAYLAPRVAKVIQSGVGKVARTVSVTLTSDGTTPRTGLSGIKWAFFDQITPDLFNMIPADSGSGATTNGSGLMTLTVNTSLAAAAVGWLVVTDSDGTTTQSPAAKAFSGPAVLS